MSLKSIANILVGSVMQSLDKRLVLGKTNTRAISILSVLNKSLNYSIVRYNSGDKDYFYKAEIINKNIQKLKYECPEICIYKDRFITDELTSIIEPIIQNNTIQIDIPFGFQTLPYNQVINGFPSSNVGAVEIISISNNLELNIDNDPVVLNYIYNPNISFTARLNYNLTYINDTSVEGCFIKGVNTEDFESAIANGHQIVEMIPDNIVFQYLEELPGGTTNIINYNIPTTDFSEESEEVFQIRIQDIFNNTVWSNIAEIQITFNIDCEIMDDCNQEITKDIPHSSSYILTPEDFGMTEDIDKIKILNVDYSTGVFRWKSFTYVPDGEIPIVVTREDLENERLYWTPSSNLESILFIEFRTSKENSFNYCNNSSTFTLTKLQNE